MEAVEGTREAVDPSMPKGKMGRNRRFGSNGHAGSNGHTRWGRTRNPRITVVIPTLNEAKNLPAVIARLPRYVHELIVVDARSEDETVAVVRRLWPEVRVIEQSGSGKGDALGLGFQAAVGDIIVTLDGDGSTDPAQLPRFVAALAAGADFAKGSRFLPGGGSDDITRLRRIGARRLTTLVNVLFRTRYTDLCYGYNAFWRDCLASFTTDTSGFEVETLMNISAARAGLTVVEVPSFEYARIHGASHLRAVRDGLRVLRTILSQRMRSRPQADDDVTTAHLTLAPLPAEGSTGPSS
jgi:glycosyltransferase involved in cell wall biosynthesis